MSTTDQQGLTEKEKEKRSHAVLVSADFCKVLLDIAFQRLLIKDGGDGSVEDESFVQEFSSASDFSQFRSRLVCKFTCKPPPSFSTIFSFQGFCMILIECGKCRTRWSKVTRSEFSVTPNAVDVSMNFQVELVRHIASQQPILAASKVAERLQSAFSSSTLESVSSKV